MCTVTVLIDVFRLAPDAIQELVAVNTWRMAGQR